MTLACVSAFTIRASRGVLKRDDLQDYSLPVTERPYWKSQVRHNHYGVDKRGHIFLKGGK